MAFTSYDDLISEMVAGKRLVLPWAKNPTTACVATNWYSMWPVGGIPGSGALFTGTALDFSRTTDVTPGALYHGGNKSTDTKHLIYQWGLASAGTTPPVFMLIDLVGYYPLTPSGSLQEMTNGTGPDRYVSAGQSGLQAVLVNGAATGSTAAYIGSLNYVDQDGNAGAMPTSPQVTVTVSAVLPTATLGARVLTTVGGPFIPLAAGDCGMRSITDVTWSAGNTGLHAFLLVKPLAILPTPAALVPAERDHVMQIANLERIYDGACLSWLVFFPTATGAALQGSIDVAWG
jgi:hypothetical protein